MIIGILIACSLAAVLTTFGIVLSLVFEAYRFFQQIPLVGIGLWLLGWLLVETWIAIQLTTVGFSIPANPAISVPMP